MWYHSSLPPAPPTPILRPSFPYYYYYYYYYYYSVLHQDDIRSVYERLIESVCTEIVPNKEMEVMGWVSSRRRENRK